MGPQLRNFLYKNVLERIGSQGEETRRGRTSRCKSEGGGEILRVGWGVKDGRERVGGNLVSGLGS